MRITQQMMTRSYKNRMSKNFSNLAKSNDRMSSQMKYSRVSDNTADVSRAFEIREQLYRNEQYSTNIRNAEGELSSVESNLRTISGFISNIKDRLLQANTDTMPASERALIAKELQGLQENVLQISNAHYGEKYLFAGSGTGKAPFSKDAATGKLMYNGYSVDDLVTNPSTGKPAIYDATKPVDEQYTDIDYNKDIYLDIGLGMVVNGDGVNAQIDTKSAIKLSTSGLEAFGYGTNSDGMPNNIYSALDKMITDITNGNMREMDKDVAHLETLQDNLLMSITDVGTRCTFLDETANRMENDSIILKTAQNKLEGVDLAGESIDNKSYEMSWMVTLQLGSKIIPPSLFDFLR